MVDKVLSLQKTFNQPKKQVKPMAPERKRIGDLLVDAGMITAEQLQDTLANKKDGQKIGDALTERGLITEKELIEVLEFQLGIPHISSFSIQWIRRFYRLFQKSLRFEIYFCPLKKMEISLSLP